MERSVSPPARLRLTSDTECPYVRCANESVLFPCSLTHSYSKGTPGYLALAKHFVTIILKRKTVKQMTRHSQCSSGTGRESKMKPSVPVQPLRLQCCSTDKKKVFNYKSYLPLQVVPLKRKNA